MQEKYTEIGSKRRVLCGWVSIGKSTYVYHTSRCGWSVANQFIAPAIDISVERERLPIFCLPALFLAMCCRNWFYYYLPPLLRLDVCLSPRTLVRVLLTQPAQDNKWSKAQNTPALLVPSQIGFTLLCPNPLKYLLRHFLAHFPSTKGTHPLLTTHSFCLDD